MRALPSPRARRGDAPRGTLVAAILCGALSSAVAAAAASGEARIEVGWISREPRLPPPASATAPVAEGWPEPGSRVHWAAHVLNRGAAAASAVPYTWRIDGEAVAAGEVELPPGETSVRLAWAWSFERHAVSFEIAPPAAADATAGDDALTVTSDALALGLWVERDNYDWLLEDGGPGFERLIQREVERWNALLARAVHPTAPHGALDRIRLERVVVVPDGQRPRNGELDTDLQWFFPNDRGDPRFLHRNMDRRYLDNQTIVLHELLHQRGLTDLYAYTVRHDFQSGAQSRVDVAEDGARVAGTPLMPATNRTQSGMTLYRLPHDGLMGTRYNPGAILTEHSANGLNLRAGRRTPLWLDRWGNLINGFANAVQPDSYLHRLPERTEVLLVDAARRPIANALVDVFPDLSWETYRKIYAADPERTLRADARGVVVVTGDLLDDSPGVVEAPPKSQVLILRARTDRARGYAFLAVHDLNMLYFRGGRERAEMELPVTLHPW